MKKFLSILIAVASILLGIYLGVWVMFIGGIVQVVNSINPVNALGIAIGICKVVLCEIAGIIPFFGIIIAEIIDELQKRGNGINESKRNDRKTKQI